jgi:NADPH:quinone reductase-like Zn-dependent oxidoreductase
MSTRTARSYSEHKIEIPGLMTGVLLVGHGGFENLQYREDIEVPKPCPGEVLIRVAAAGINNTDINTRIGWYSKTVKSGTDAGGTQGFEIQDADARWSGVPMAFPRIQGGDCCGRIVAVGSGVDAGRDWCRGGNRCGDCTAAPI